VTWTQNPAFSRALPIQLALDSTTLGAMKKCPRLFELAHVRGWGSRRRSIDLEFGILLHSAREGYYRRRANEEDHNAALAGALNFALSASWDFELDRPLAIFCEDNYKNRFTLARTLVWYLDQWENDPLETVILAGGAPAVEVSFRFPLGIRTAQDEEYLLCGHMDRLVRFNDRLWVSDLKSTRHSLDSTYFAQYTPDNQMSTYSVAGKVVLNEPTAGIILDAAQVGVGFSRFARGLIYRTTAQLEEWLRGVEVLLHQYEEYARAQFWPQNEKSCWGCSFRPICARSPQVRENWLKSDFVERQWNPLEVRGDI